jgi:hypothetical protein
MVIFLHLTGGSVENYGKPKSKNQSLRQDLKLGPPKYKAGHQFIGLAILLHPHISTGEQNNKQWNKTNLMKLVRYTGIRIMVSCKHRQQVDYHNHITGSLCFAPLSFSSP